MRRIQATILLSPLLALFVFASTSVAQYDSKITDVKQYVNGTPDVSEYDDGDELKTRVSIKMINPNQASFMDFKLELKYLDDQDNVVKEDDWTWTVGVAATLEKIKILTYDVPDPTTSDSYCLSADLLAKVDGEWVVVDTTCALFTKQGTIPE